MGMVEAQPPPGDGRKKRPTPLMFVSADVGGVSASPHRSPLSVGAPRHRAGDADAQAVSPTSPPTTTKRATSSSRHQTPRAITCPRLPSGVSLRAATRQFLNPATLGGDLVNSGTGSLPLPGQDLGPPSTPSGHRRRSSAAASAAGAAVAGVPSSPRVTQAPRAASAEPPSRIHKIGGGLKIYDVYEWDQVLQEEGDGGKVVVCRPKGIQAGEGKDFVMKMKSKATMIQKGILNEFLRLHERILSLRPHPGVVRVHEVFEDDRFYYVVMELAGVELLPALLNEFEDGVLPSSVLKRIIKQILETLRYLHRNGILHRDIKPDNLVLRPPNPRDVVKAQATGDEPGLGQVVLIDFDHACPDYDPLLRCARDDICGTLRFNAPETFLGYFSHASDLYSVGVVLYLLMTGKMPYDDMIFEDAIEAWNREEASGRADGRRLLRAVWVETAYQRLKEFEVDWSCNPWPTQPVCEDFCRALLAFEPARRPVSAKEAMNHEWLRAC